MAKPNFTLPNKPAIKSGSILSYNYTDDFTFVPAPLTFNRDSAATRVNEKGLIEDVGYFGPELIQNGDFSEIGSEEVTNGDFSQIGSELITNGDFSTSGTPNTSSWSLGWYSNTNNVIISDGKLTMTNSASESDSRAYATNGTSSNNIITTNKFYKLQYDIVSNNGVTDFKYYSEAGTFISVPSVEVGSYTIYIRNTSNSLFLFQNGTSNSSISIDNVSVKEVGQNWTFSDGATITGNGARIVSDGAYQRITQDNTLTIGKQYKLQYEIVENNSGNLKVQTSLGIDPIPSTVGVHTVYGKAVQTYLTIERSGACDATITNISVKEVGQNWTFNTGWSMGDGVAIATSGSGTANKLVQTNTLNGKYAKVSLDVSNYGGSGLILVDFGSTNSSSITSNGTHILYGTYDQNDFHIYKTADFSGNIDNISVIEVLGDKPRIDYSDSLTEPSLLLEPQSTNLITYSEDFSNSSWVKNGFGNALAPVVTLNSNISPDGTQNASRIQMDCTSNLSSDYSAIYQQLALDGSSEYTISFYIKSNTSSEQDLLFFSNSSFSTQITANSEWQRVESTFTSNSTNIRNFGLVAKGNVQQDVDVLIYGAQLEQLSYATSYIPTAGSTATRLGETATNAGDVNVFNSEEGVLYAEIAALANDGTIRYFGLSDGSSGNRALFLCDSTANRVRAIVSSGGTKYVDFNYNVTDITEFHKIALKYKTDDFALWIDGVERNTDTSGLTPIGLDRFEFQLSGSGDFYGKVRNLKVFNKALTDKELEILTIQ